MQTDKPMDEQRLRHNSATCDNVFSDARTIHHANELAMSSATALLAQIPPPHSDSHGQSKRRYAVTVFVQELTDTVAAAPSGSSGSILILQGLWAEGQFEIIDSLEPPHTNGRQALLGPTMAERKAQQQKLSRQHRITRRLFTASACLVFLLCCSGVVSLSAWITRDRAVSVAVHQQRAELTRASDARLAAAAADAARREASITEALRRESELRARSERQIQTLEHQRRLDHIAREALGMFLRNDLAAAAPKLQQALDLLHARNDRRGRAILLLSAAAANLQRSNHELAEQQLQQVLDELAQLPEQESELTIEVFTRQAEIARARQHPAEALKHLAQVLRLREQSWGHRDARLIPLLREIALASFELQRYDEVESTCTRIQSIRAREQRAASPEAVDDLLLLALAQARQGKLDEAATVCKRILLIEPALEPPQRARFQNAFTELAHVYVGNGRYSQAMLLLERALRHGQRHDPLSQRLAGEWRLLAKLYVRERRYAQAEAIYRRLIDSRELSMGNDDPQLADDAAELAELYEQQDRLGEAEALYRLAMDIRERSLGPYHTDVARSAAQLAELYRVQGKTAQAEALYDLAREIRRKAAREERR